MSTRPGVVTSRMRARSSAAFLAIASTAIVACDQPTNVAVDRVDGLSSTLSNTVDCLASPIGGGNGKTVVVNVSLSQPWSGATLGSSVLVTLVSPTDGPVCEAAANPVATFQNVANGAKFVVQVRDEVNESASQVQIAPPHPGAGVVTLVADAPSIPGVHHRPTLISGGTACGTLQALTWANYVGSFATPCQVPNGGAPGSTYAISAPLPSVGGVQGTLVGMPDGTIYENVIVSALSPWTGGSLTDQQAACNLLVWLSEARKTECGTPALSDGAAVLQAMVAAKSDKTFSIGSVAAGSPLVIETVLAGNGFTFFGTATPNAAGSYNVYVVPGMCRVDDDNTVVDETNPNNATLDILRTFSTIGLRTFATSPLDPMTLEPVRSTAIVGAIIQANAADKGEFAMSYRLSSGGGTLSVKATFSIDPQTGACLMNSGSGSGLGLIAGSTVAYLGTCARTSATIFKLAFVLTGLPLDVNRSTMSYTLKAGRDNIDAARFSLLKGAIPYMGQDDETCPVPTNNDGRYDLGI
jgi:hypothetical protein